jgi:hypothetical protein
LKQKRKNHAHRRNAKEYAACDVGGSGSPRIRDGIVVSLQLEAIGAGGGDAMDNQMARTHLRRGQSVSDYVADRVGGLRIHKEQVTVIERREHRIAAYENEGG